MASSTSITLLPHSKRSLVPRISMLVLGCLAITVMLATIIYVVFASNGLQAEIDRRHRLLSDNLSIVIETAWREDNYPFMVQIIDSLSSDRDIYLAQIIDKNGIVLIASDTAKTGLPSQATLSSDITVPISSLGTLEIYTHHYSQDS